MAYRLRSVVKYAKGMADELYAEFHPVFQDKKQQPVEMKVHWGDHLEQVRRHRQIFQEQSASKTALAAYARAVEYSAQYLIDKNIQVQKERMDEIVRWVDELNVAYKSLYPQKPLYPPNPIRKPVEHHFSGGAKGFSELAHEATVKRELQAHQPKKTIKQKAKQLISIGSDEEEILQEQDVGDFLDSQEFGKLKEYLERTLRHDDRSHSYLCGLINLSVNKIAPLERLIMALESQSTVEGIKNVLQNFYSSKNHAISHDGEKTWGESDYDILNKGQNITTRFFGLRTTTISLIDDLAKSIGFNPALTESINQSGSKFAF
ncbi:hypothetical protein [Legionella micdadei]|nr:hypothetical protein [Legionella micdadei]ARG99213.1 hypothetical protein B6V88_01490 [Legionella micdadei]KTD29445.1 hypothetical protein Lmic_0517 [Legionella micdadei]NSL18157.1 hypothetical protein [Legionella micdadei]SCX97026.1 hypothetical protein SAMN02982997_00544 [Legionella micdadei]